MHTQQNQLINIFIGIWINIISVSYRLIQGKIPCQFLGSYMIPNDMFQSSTLITARRAECLWRSAKNQAFFLKIITPGLAKSKILLLYCHGIFMVGKSKMRRKLRRQFYENLRKIDLDAVRRRYLWPLEKHGELHLHNLIMCLHSLRMIKKLGLLNFMIINRCFHNFDR